MEQSSCYSCCQPAGDKLLTWKQSFIDDQPAIIREIVVEHFHITAIFEEKLPSLFVLRKYRVVFALFFFVLLPVCVDYYFCFISPSVFSNVYLHKKLKNTNPTKNRG